MAQAVSQVLAFQSARGLAPELGFLDVPVGLVTLLLVAHQAKPSGLGIWGVGGCWGQHGLLGVGMLGV